MRPPRSPTLLPGLAIAVAGLATAVIVFATASALVAFGLWPERAPNDGAEPIVLPRVPAQPAPEQQPPGRAGAIDRSRPGGRSRARTLTRDVPSRGARPRDSAVTVLPGSGRPTSASPPPPPPPPPAPDVARGGGPLEAVADAVPARTRALAGTVRGTTTAVERALAPVVPAVEPAVGQTGELLATSVDGIGGALAGLLGSPAR